MLTVKETHHKKMMAEIMLYSNMCVNTTGSRIFRYDIPFKEYPVFKDLAAKFRAQMQVGYVKKELKELKSEDFIWLNVGFKPEDLPEGVDMKTMRPVTERHREGSTVELDDKEVALLKSFLKQREDLNNLEEYKDLERFLNGTTEATEQPSK